ncbi:phosphate acyltransferase PlsX [Rubrobacter taiwanensis]|uniref:Phosphate acyltransferase n=1 Tax=Rubrobacter taiwanensis TaxID=185139 RepID=A0A4R1BHQ1_9ACTN|nr:phosphate acyltransferase PlsX [Rubrobacter taiwanensis]TCJ16658.1 phosphate acyltransferase PlsX [Rubrobacter taiwanensis]
MRIAVDALGGDYAPEEVVSGALAAARGLLADEILLVGDPETVEPLLGSDRPENLSLRPSRGSVGMEEDPAASLRARPEASVAVAARLVRSGEAEAFFSAGNTGATVAAALLWVGRIRGIRRPAIATVMPFPKGSVLLLDAGATVECRPQDLLSFAVMGSIFARRYMKIEEPRVGLVNVGEEPGKGGRLAREAHKLLAGCATIRFVGNVEGRDIGRGAADVLVTDGFTGNVVLKTAEGVAREILAAVRDAVSGSLLHRAAAGILRPRLLALRSRLDPETYGGSFLLGVDGVVVIGHGNTRARGVENAIRGISRAGAGLAGDLGESLRREGAL